MRVVLDSNIFCRAFIGQKGPCRSILTASYRLEFSLLVSNAIVTEILHILWEKANKDKLHDSAKKELVGRLLRAMSRAVDVNATVKRNICVEDPEDDKFIWCAIEGNADIIVSADKDLLNLNGSSQLKNKKGKSIQVLSPEDFQQYMLIKAVNQKRN